MNRVLDLLMVISPALVGVTLAGWSPWVLLSSVFGVAMFLLNRPRFGLAINILMQSVLAYRHGLVAYLFLGGLWMAWAQSRLGHVLAAVALAVCGALATASLVREIAWSSSAAVIAVTVSTEWVKRVRRQ